MNPHLALITAIEKAHPDLRDAVFTAHEFPSGWAIHIEFPTSYSMNMTMLRFQEFYESPFPSIRAREEWLESQISVCLGVTDICDEDAPEFYVIGTYKGNRNAKSTLAHEMAHARYFLDPEYNAVVTSLVIKNWSKALERALRKRGYDASTYIDEMHAFALTGWGEWFPWYLRDKAARRLRRVLRRAYPQEK